MDDSKLLEIATKQTKSTEVIYDPVIAHFVSQRKLRSGTTRIPNSVLYEYYKMWHRQVGRFKFGRNIGIINTVYSRMKFFGNFKKVFGQRRYRTKHKRGYLLDKAPFMDYFPYDHKKDTFYENKIKEGFKRLSES